MPTSSSPVTKKPTRIVYDSHSNSFSTPTTSQTSSAASNDNKQINTFQRPESPTLPPENGKVHDTMSSTSMLNDNHRDLKLNLIKSSHSSTRSSDIGGPASPTSTIDTTTYQMQQQLEESAHRMHRRPSRSKSKHRHPTTSYSSSSSTTKSHSHSKQHVHSSNNKTPDHLAAAIELSTTNAVAAPAPAAGMYWSRTLTYGRGPSRPLRAHTANLIGEKLYVFGGCDTSLCFNTLYILDMGRYFFLEDLDEKHSTNGSL
ncbi:unnamed protein product [Mucor circinelloides]